MFLQHFIIFNCALHGFVLLQDTYYISSLNNYILGSRNCLSKMIRNCFLTHHGCIAKWKSVVRAFGWDDRTSDTDASVPQIDPEVKVL